VDFNEFLDGLMEFPEVQRIVLVDHLLEKGWDICDVDLDIEIKGGAGSPALNKFLAQYETTHKFQHSKTGKKEIVGHSGSGFIKVGRFFLEICWGCKPYTVPYIVLRERVKRSSMRKKKWVK
jgi:hypothetical protein